MSRSTSFNLMNNLNESDSETIQIKKQVFMEGDKVTIKEATTTTDLPTDQSDEDRLASLKVQLAKDGDQLASDEKESIEKEIADLEAKLFPIDETDESKGKVEKSFEEIINDMEVAEDYSDLYTAASYIVDDNLRADVEELIGQCEDDNEDVGTAYSLVTSDLLDNKINDLNESVNQTDLPDNCYDFNDNTNQIIIIKKGQTGYYPTDIEFENKEQAEDIINKANEALKVTPEQRDAMRAASMFGWNTTESADTDTTTDTTTDNITENCTTTLKEETTDSEYYNKAIADLYDEVLTLAQEFKSINPDTSSKLDNVLSILDTINKEA